MHELGHRCSWDVAPVNLRGSPGRLVYSSIQQTLCSHPCVNSIDNTTRARQGNKLMMPHSMLLCRQSVNPGGFLNSTSSCLAAFSGTQRKCLLVCEIRPRLQETSIPTRAGQDVEARPALRLLPHGGKVRLRVARLRKLSSLTQNPS
jgi:hypothetical protein